MTWWRYVKVAVEIFFGMCQLSEMQRQSNYFHYLYVMRSPAGLHKIGCSRQPTVRAQQLQCELGMPIVLVHTKRVRRDAFRRESAAKRKLAQFNVFGEWFAIPLDLAIAAL
jgi:hypothetical protein